MVSMRGTVIRELDYDPTYDKPAYEGEAQLPGPGFASFKPYLRPYYFKFRVCWYLVCACMCVCTCVCMCVCVCLLTL